MTSRKRDTEKKGVEELKKEVQKLRFQDVTVTTEDGREHNVRVRIHGDESSDDVKASALEYIQRRREAEAYAKEPTPEKIAERAEELARIASDTITTTLLVKVQDNDGKGALGKTSRVAAGVTFTDFRRRLKEHFRQIVLELLEDPDLKAQLFSELEKEAVAAVLGELAKHEEPEGLTEQEREEYWSRLYDEVGEKKLASTLAFYAIGIAKQVLDQLDADTMTADRLVAWYQRREGGDQAGELVTLGTDPIQTEMRKHLLRHALQADADKEAWTADRKSRIRIRTSATFEDFKKAVEAGKGYDFSKASIEYAFEEQENVLENIQRTLLGVKKHGAALLKLHLDLTNAAYDVGGDRPSIFYNFADALDRLGYHRNEARRGHHNEAMQRMRDRLITLRTHTVAAYYTKHAGKEYLTRTPYWLVRSFHEPRQPALDFVDDLDTLTRGMGATAYTAVTIEPGDWWKSTNMSTFRLQVPGEVLRLPTDGKKNEPERMALLIASHLAIEIRRNQSQHAGKSIRRKAGALLEESGITSWEEFSDQHPTQAARRRDYLNDLNDEGALAILRRLKAFDVTVHDEADFFASGRGWREKFWGARLEIHIPDLGIRKRLTT